MIHSKYVRHPLGKRLCDKCHREYEYYSANGRYCRDCQKRQAHKLGTRPKAISRRSFDMPLSCGTVGAIRELEVSADLMRRGYEVFRALSPSCSCDLAILKDGRLFRIEVRTVHQNIKSFEKSHTFQKIRADIVAAVTSEGKIIHYIPSLPEL